MEVEEVGVRWEIDLARKTMTTDEGLSLTDGYRVESQLQ